MKSNNNVAKRRINHVKTFFSEPANCMLLVFFVAFLGLSVYPLFAMLKEIFLVHSGIEKTMTGLSKGSFTWFHFKKLFFDGEWSKITFFIPLGNSFMLGLFSAVLAILFGGTVAWLMARSNMKFKGLISALFLFPYIMPAWTLAQY